jgi:hypothetical protein
MAKPAYERETKRLSPKDVQSAISYTLLIAESHRSLAKGEHETYPGTLGALTALPISATSPATCARRPFFSASDIVITIFLGCGRRHTGLFLTPSGLHLV